MAAGLVAVIGLRYIAQDLIAPILMAGFFAALMFPFFKSLRQRGYQSSWAMIIMLSVFVLGIFGIVAFITWSFQLVTASLSPIFEQLQSNMEGILTAWGVDTSSATSLAQQVSPNQVLSFFSSLLSQLGSLTLFFVLVPIMAILTVLQIDKVPPKLWNELMTENSALVKAKHFANTISLYISNRFKINSITGIMVFILLTVLNIPFALVWGFLTVMMSFIPYIGLLIAGAPPTILAFAAGGFPAALTFVIGIFLINMFVENVLEPVIQGSSTKISAAAIVIALVFWTWLLGPVGAIMSTPLTVLLKMILSEYQETHWISTLMEGKFEQSRSELKKENGLQGMWQKVLRIAK